MENITLGDISNNIQFWATLITSISVLFGFALAIGRIILKKALEPFNARINETIENNNKNHNETKTQIDELTRIVDNNDIDAVRSRIVAFENLCRMDKNFNTLKRHQFKTIFKDIDKWRAYHIKYPQLNGEIDIAIESINEHYKKEIF